jgi:CubicO group peptidase (beta-lactamase class C family)
MKTIPLIALAATALAASPGAGFAQDALERFLAVPGARATLPVEAAKEPFSRAFVDEARARFDNFHLQMGGDHTLYYLAHLSEFMQTAMSMPAADFRALERAPNDTLAGIVVETASEGPLALVDYVAHPRFRHQGVMMVHEGRVVFEAYPGMTPTDVHFWASAAKTTIGLVTALLVIEGRIDPERPVTDYVPALAGSAWEQASVLDVLNHTTGLQTEETAAAILDPDSEVVAFFSASFGAANPGSGEREGVVETLRRFVPLEGEGPGDVFRYSSANTHVLTMMIEAVEERPWAAIFEERVWGRLGARMPAMFNLDPDGVAMPLGLLSTTLEDMARFGMLFTPSAAIVATTEIVTPEVLRLIYDSADREGFPGSAKDLSGQKSFGEPAVANSYQFDWVFEDGALAKSGNLNQMIYVDPGRDFVGVVFSSTPYVDGYGETKMPEFFRRAAKLLAGDAG